MNNPNNGIHLKYLNITLCNIELHVYPIMQPVTININNISIYLKIKVVSTLFTTLPESS